MVKRDPDAAASCGKLRKLIKECVDNISGVLHREKRCHRTDVGFTDKADIRVKGRRRPVSLAQKLSAGRCFQ